MIKFGTSGFRGIMGDNFNKQNLQKIAYAVSKLIKDEKVKAPVIDIGFDNRFMGEFYAKLATEVFVAYGIKINFYENSTPTPAIAYLSKEHTFGVVLTASHNPYYYNGIKIFKNGGEIVDGYAQKIEQIANSVDTDNIKTLEFETALKKGQICLVKHIESYEMSVVSFLNKKTLKNRNLKVLFNVMHGNGTVAINNIMKKLGLKNFEIMNANIDPYFEYELPAPYLKNLTTQKQRVVKERFDLGIALDGDSDRVSFIDNNGEMYDCNYIVPLLYKYLIENKKMKGGVAHNIAFTSLLSYVVKELGQEEHIAKVGFKNIAEKFETTDAILGAETTGIALKEHVYCKDGILSGLLVLDMLSSYEKNITDLLKEVKKKFNYPCKVYEFAYPITDKKKAEIQKKVFEDRKVPCLIRKIENVDYFDGVKFYFDKKYWAEIRFSGNENVVRIFAEMENDKACHKMIAEIEKFVGVSERQ